VIDAPPPSDLWAVTGSPEVTQWPQRLLLTAAMVAVVLLAVFGMWRGWRNRADRQADLPELPAAPDERGIVLAGCDGRYVGTVRSGDWLDRIVARGLGAPGRTLIEVTAAGLWLDRDGAPAVFIPAADLTGVGTGKGLAGDVVERDGLAVVSWRLGTVQLDTAFRADRATDQRAVMEAVSGLVQVPTGGTE
jgi:hypothetical protein